MASVSGGECRAIPPPGFAFAGKAAPDQAYIDDVIEAGIAACGWARPQPRPASWDVPPVVKAPPMPKPRRKWLDWRTSNAGGWYEAARATYHTERR